MSDTGKQTSPVSRLIRERAMAILRDTRSKIDPKLLDAMKDHLTAVMPAGSIPGTPDADMPLSGRTTAEPGKAPKAAAPAAAAAYRQTSAAVKPPTQTAEKKDSFSAVMKMQETPAAKAPPVSQPSYPAKMLDAPSGPSETEPVDRQKIAQIVLEYMKNREEGHKH